MPFMLPSILRNVFSGPATRPYPANPRQPFADARGELVNDPETCIFCSICAKKCPSQCLVVDKELGTWEWDPFACVYCGVCAEACPTKSLRQTNVRRAVARDKQSVAVQGQPKPKKSP